MLTGGDSPFGLQNGGSGTCAVVYEGELVMMGGRKGRSDPHGHVDR